MLCPAGHCAAQTTAKRGERGSSAVGRGWAPPEAVAVVQACGRDPAWLRKEGTEVVGAEGSVPIPDGSGGSQLHSLPIFPGAQTPPPGRLRRGLAWPGTSQPTFQVLVVLAYPCGRARTPGASPQSPWPGPPAPSGTCPGLKSHLEAEEIPEAEVCWSPLSMVKQALSSSLTLPSATGISLPAGRSGRLCDQSIQLQPGM